MNRRILNLMALAIIGAGTTHLLAQPAEAAVQEYCCVSGTGAECCGTLYCSADQDSCTARDKEE